MLIRFTILCVVGDTWMKFSEADFSFGYVALTAVILSLIDLLIEGGKK